MTQNALNLIKKWEGCRLTAYKDEGGVWTIGWGHTAGVYEGQTITQEVADAMLAEDVAAYNNAVKAYDPKYHWTANEEDALTSFAYNLGTGSISQVTANGTRSKEVIAQKMLLYVNVNGKPSDGLKNRRRDEVNLFLSGGEVPDPGDGSGGPSTEEPDSEFFPIYDEYNTKIDLIFHEIGADKYYKDAPYAWQRRLPIAEANGMPSYTGLSRENRALANLAKAGFLRRPK